MDHHLGCDQLEILHTGARLSRAEKIELLADQAVFRDNLFVCFREPEFAPGTGAVRNCGKCEKCNRTIVAVDIIGTLGQFPTLAN